MLYFSKLKVIFIYILIILLSYFSISNFLSQNYKFSDKKINLGLDLQGGSYLLLEVDSNPIVLQKLQKKFSRIRQNPMKLHVGCSKVGHLPRIWKIIKND